MRRIVIGILALVFQVNPVAAQVGVAPGVSLNPEDNSIGYGGEVVAMDSRYGWSGSLYVARETKATGILSLQVSGSKLTFSPVKTTISKIEVMTGPSFRFRGVFTSLKAGFNTEASSGLGLNLGTFDPIFLNAGIRYFFGDYVKMTFALGVSF